MTAGNVTPREPTLATLLVDAINSRLTEFRVSLPCKVAKYNASDGTVDVDILLKDQRPQSDGSVKLLTFPTVQDVPVQWFRCGTAWITLPIKPGDLGKLVFCDRSLSVWGASSKGTVVDPKTLSLHNFDGATFEPGLYPPTAAIPSPDPDNIVIHSDTKVMLGEKGLSDDQRAAVSKLVKDELDKINTAFSGHTHTVALGACTAGGNTGVATTTGGPNYSPSSVAAQKVYVK